MGKEEQQTRVGVVVSEGHLYVFVRPIGERFAVSNDEAGIHELFGQLRGHVRS